jgi:glycosyltransferase involved in cell wall biosynthesis
MSTITIGKKKKVFYVISLVHKSLAFEWISIRLKEYYDITFVLLNPDNSPLEDFLRKNNNNVIRIAYKNKKKIPLTFCRFLWLLIKARPAIVHTHLFDATLIGLATAWLARIKRRIYTRHNSSYHHLYHPAAVKYDRFTNFLATEIISISQATDEVLVKLENVSPDKIVKIHHGFDLSDFLSIDPQRIKIVKKKWSIPATTPCIGVVARHIEWKGIQYIIPAFESFLKLFPNACLVLANASGPFHEDILALLKNIPKESYVLIPFEEDIAALYRLFDLYVHVPIDGTCEAFGQTYIEALASGVPSVFSLSGIAKEFVCHRENAWVVEFKNSASILEGMEALWRNPELRSHLIENGKQNVFSHFGIESMIARLRHLYDR